MNNQIGLKQGFEERLDIVAENIINNEKCPIPGFVVIAKRGNHNYHKAFGKKISLDKQPSPAYPGSGPEGLINGMNGSDTRYGDKEWLGFSGEDFEVTLDLGGPTAVQSVQTRFFEGNGQWIYLPAEVSFAGYTDDNQPSTNFSSAAPVRATDNTFSVTHETGGQEWRYIRIRVKNYGTIPPGKQGAGNKAWTFIDEIIVN